MTLFAEEKKEEKVALVLERILCVPITPTTNFWGVGGVVKDARTIPPPVETPFTYVPSSQGWLEMPTE